MASELTTQENNFIENLLNGMSIGDAGELAGYTRTYSYVVRKRLSKEIVEAAQDHLAMNAIRASRKVVDSIDGELPNPVQLSAANSLLDRVGIVKKESTITNHIKANIFILPEKKEVKQIIDV